MLPDAQANGLTHSRLTEVAAAQAFDLFSQHRHDIISLSQTMGAVLDRIRQEARTEVATYKLTTRVCVGISLAVLLVILRGASVLAIRPNRALTAVTRRLARGEYGVEVPFAGRGNELGTGVGEVRAATAPLARAADLARRTEAQAASLKETTAALEEITAVAVVATTGAAGAPGMVGAGEAGRGFAVVATEVRALAQRSAEATWQIKDLIGASGGEVDDGVALVGQAGRRGGASARQWSGSTSSWPPWASSTA